LTLCIIKHHSIKACRGGGGIAQHILNLFIRLKRVVSFAPRPLYSLGKEYLLPNLGGLRDGLVLGRRENSVLFLECNAWSLQKALVCNLEGFVTVLYHVFE
jgi:hypothetical protein